MKRTNYITTICGFLMLSVVSISAITMVVSDTKDSLGNNSVIAIPSTPLSQKQEEGKTEYQDPMSEIHEVDLNDYLSTPYDDTDYNATEIGEEEMRILTENGVYYDEALGRWRKYNNIP